MYVIDKCTKSSIYVFGVMLNFHHGFHPHVTSVPWVAFIFRKESRKRHKDHRATGKIPLRHFYAGKEKPPLRCKTNQLITRKATSEIHMENTVAPVKSSL